MFSNRKASHGKKQDIMLSCTKIKTRKEDFSPQKTQERKRRKGRDDSRNKASLKEKYNKRRERLIFSSFPPSSTHGTPHKLLVISFLDVKYTLFSLWFLYPNWDPDVNLSTRIPEFVGCHQLLLCLEKKSLEENLRKFHGPCNEVDYKS